MTRIAWQTSADGLTVHQRFHLRHKERRNADSRAYHATHRDQRRAQHQAWYIANADERRRYRRVYGAAHKEQERDSYRRWRAANREQAREQTRRRRARKIGNGGAHTLAEWIEKLALLGGRCLYCGSDGSMEQDHKTPLSRGGSDDIANIVPACRPCNMRKRNRTAAEFLYA